MPRNYRCNGCNALITERDTDILTGLRNGQRVFYHRQYPQSVRDKIDSTDLGLVFLSGISTCAMKIEVEGSLENLQTITYSQIEELATPVNIL